MLFFLCLIFSLLQTPSDLRASLILRCLQWSALFQVSPHLWVWDEQTLPRALCHSSRDTKKSQTRVVPFLTQSPLKQIFPAHRHPKVSLKTGEAPVPTNYPFCISQVQFKVQILPNAISLFASLSQHAQRRGQRISLPFLLAGCVKERWGLYLRVKLRRL